MKDYFLDPHFLRSGDTLSVFCLDIDKLWLSSKRSSRTIFGHKEQIP